MMFRVKAFILVALTVLLSVMVVACGGSNTTGNSSSPVTISYWTWNPDVNTVKTEVTAFEKQYPNIHVDYKVPTYTDYLVNLKAAANAGSLPTVFGMQVGGMQAQWSGQSAAITRF